jgi:hypothetical protein
MVAYCRFYFLEKVGCKSESDGTWAVCELVEIFKAHREHEDISSMLLKVNENACKAHAKKGYKQPCQLVFTTTKKIYLPSTAIGKVYHVRVKCKRNIT